MSIVTVTFHPTIDKFFTVPDMQPYSKLHAENIVRKPGGGGLNISKVLHTLRISSNAIYGIGGFYASFFNDLIQREGYCSMPIFTESDIRENIIILNQKNKDEFRFNMPLNELNERNYDDFLKAIVNGPIPTYLILSGSFGTSFSKTWYRQLAQWAADHRVKIVADTKRENLQIVCEEGVYLIKPNLKEFNMIAAKPAYTQEDIIKEGLHLIEKFAVAHILVSMGQMGVMWISANRQQFFPAVRVAGYNSVGTGDSFLAGVMKELVGGNSMEKAIEFGVLCGAASAMNTNNSILEMKDLVCLQKG
jgi:6-phosphofructokinase 2